MAVLSELWRGKSWKVEAEDLKFKDAHPWLRREGVFKRGREKGVAGDSAEKATPFTWWDSTHLSWVKTALDPPLQIWEVRCKAWVTRK